MVGLERVSHSLMQCNIKALWYFKMCDRSFAFLNRRRDTVDEHRLLAWMASSHYCTSERRIQYCERSGTVHVVNHIGDEVQHLIKPLHRQSMILHEQQRK